MLNDKNQQFRPWPLSACWDRKGKTIKEGRGNPVVKISPSNAGGAGSTPGLRAKIPYALWPKSQNKIEVKIVIKSTKTLKMVHIENNLKKFHL